MGKTGRADRGSKRFSYKGGGPPVVFVGLCSPHWLTSLIHLHVLVSTIPRYTNSRTTLANELGHHRTWDRLWFPMFLQFPFLRFTQTMQGSGSWSMFPSSVWFASPLGAVFGRFTSPSYSSYVFIGEVLRPRWHRDVGTICQANWRSFAWGWHWLPLTEMDRFVMHRKTHPKHCWQQFAAP